MTLKEQRNALDHLKAERERLQNVYREKAKQSDHLNQLAQSFDTKLNKMRQNLRNTSDKVCIYKIIIYQILSNISYDSL